MKLYELERGVGEAHRASARSARAYALGLRAEAAAERMLQRRGYHILAQRYRTPYGEIDLIAKRGGVVAFIEVKARATLSQAAHAVSARQQARIVNAASHWCAQQEPSQAEQDYRFDVVLFAPGQRPQHIENAFMAA